MFRKTHLDLSIALAWILSSLINHTAAASTPCDRLLDLEPNTVRRDHVPFAETSFRWRLPSAGLATVDLLAPEPSSAWLDLHGATCGEARAEVSVIRQSPGHLVLAVHSAGDVYLASGGRVPSFRLVTSFVEAEVVEEVFDLGPEGFAVRARFLAADLLDKVEPEVIDPEPDGRETTTRRLLASLLRRTPSHGMKVEPEVIDPEPDGQEATGNSARLRTPNRFMKVEPEVIDPEPDGLIVEGSDPRSVQTQVLHFERICRPTERDDHGDTPSCATPLDLGQQVTGELANDWNDDRDVFSLHLSQVARVEMALVAEASGITLELSNEIGQRLAVEPGTVDGAGENLAVRLGPGRYFLHVSGFGGRYSLQTKADL